MYHDFYEVFEALSAEDRGALIMAIFDHENGRAEPQDLSPVVNIAYLVIRRVLDRDAKSYADRCEQNSQNGKKGGRPKKTEAEFEESEKSERFFEKAKKADSDSDSDNDSDSDRDGVWEAEPFLCESISDSISEPISDPISDLAPLTEEDREILRKKGIPSRYVAERETRATDYARSHGDTALNVLISWWQSDRLSPKYAEMQRAEYRSAPRSSPPHPFVSDGIGEKDPKGTSVGDRSFDVNDFFASAVERTCRD